jgi:D-aspartate oxidase
MKKALIEKGVSFVQRRITTLDEVHPCLRDSFASRLQLSDEFDVIVNCAGIEGGRLAGDDSSVYPIRGITFEVGDSAFPPCCIRDNSPALS